ncbi:restriction endonuclease [Malaciobacter canalis]|uniref:Restriction endonuclease n=1 Tax=Malaciobacter canalis TaxID=1912871 RepID=A0ABX4LQQ7_9BACT|nr:restriction endonuclease [Malaciobacter canalis]PHO08879.1 restriction endonuclease [Malaciobacter canalis]QEE34042.1 type IV methyl-directed restriction system, component McrC [Malaciobacter canalis]
MKLYEYEKIPSQYEKLIEHIKENIALHQYFKEDWGDVKTKQYCGILSFEKDDYYLLPKISNDENTNLDIFIYMLMYVYDIKLSNEQIASCKNEKSETLLEVLVQMFVQNLLDELKKGIYKEYVTHEDNLRTLKGKYLINENLKYNFVKTKIYCEYDEFSENNTLNQFFLYTIKNLQKFVKNKKYLKQCELIFDEVESFSFDVDLLNIHFTRVNKRFEKSYYLALLLLKRLIPLYSKGKNSFAFLFDMNVLFEKFIAKVIKSIDNNAKIQNQNSFGNLLLKPDIILKNQIIDTKYKRIKSLEDLKQSDKLQAFAYGINYGLKNAVLLYPKHLDDVNKELFLGENENKICLKINSIDLNFEGNFKEFIEEIKRRLERIL